MYRSFLMKNLYSAFSRRSRWTPQNTLWPINSHTGATSVSMLKCLCHTCQPFNKFY